MNSMAVLDKLGDGLLSGAEMDDIKKSQTTRGDKARELISILSRKREEIYPFERFVEALKKTDQSHAVMVETILKTYKQNRGTIEFEEVSRTSLSDAEETEYDLPKESDKDFQFKDDSLNKECLTKSLTFLCEKMAADEVIVRLQSDKVLTQYQADVIRAEKTSFQKNMKLIELVQQRDAVSFSCFMKSLTETAELNILL
uniref:CARD domain-containing protein n=1 Tax=Plectus sambesii TaxID=2011161 RepID=A0A914VVP2_9BILA